MKITQLKINNFKCLENLDLKNLDNINQVVGSNGVGKTSLKHAVQFLFEGSGKDKLKIMDGKDTATVEATMLIREQEVRIVNTVKRDGTSKQELCVNGEWHKQSKRKLIKELFGMASFNPLDIVEPKNRASMFKRLVKGDFKIPEAISIIIKKWNIEDCPTVKDLPENPIEALAELRAFFEMYRKQTYKVKHTFKEVYGDAEQEVKNLNGEILQSGYMDENLNISELLKEKAKFDLEKENKDDLIKSLNKNKETIELKEFQIEKETKLIEDMQRSINDKQQNVVKLKTELKQVKIDLEEGTTILDKIKSTPVELLEKINVAKLVERMRQLKSKSDERYKQFLEKEQEYTDANRLLRNEFNGFYAEYLEHIKKHIPNLGFSDGIWTYKEKNIDTLSSSEMMTLALELLSCQDNKSNIICIDNAEMFDPETIKKIAIHTEGTVYFLMKVGEKFKDLTSNVVTLQ